MFKRGWPLFSRVPKAKFYSQKALKSHGLASVDAPLSYTVLDKRGRIISAGAQMSRTDFLKKNGLHTRDLRHIDGQAALVPRILVQNGLMLVNMMNMRVLIRKDKLLIFESKDQKVSERLGMLSYDLTTKLSRPAEQPYEQIALETILIHAIAYLEIELTKVVESIEIMLQTLENQVDREGLRELLIGSQNLNNFYLKALAVRKALEDAMDDEDDINKMYLTAGKAPTSDKENSVDIQLLLETYYKQADELVQQADKTGKEVNITEDIINMMIDSNRNALMLYRLHVSILTVSIALSLFVADLYGMNLENYIEEQDWGMPLVIIFIIAVNMAGTIFNYKTLRHTESISMDGVMTRSSTASREMMRKWLRNHRV